MSRKIHYVSKNAQDGRCSIKLPTWINNILTAYAKETNQNKTRLVEKYVMEGLDHDWQALLSAKTKEEIMSMIKRLQRAGGEQNG